MGNQPCQDRLSKVGVISHNTIENLRAQVKRDNFLCAPDKLGHLVGCGEGVMYLMLLGRPKDIGFLLGQACYPCSR